MKVSKKRKSIIDLIDKEKSYTLDEACVLVKTITNTNFDSSVDLDVRLGVDPRQANQMVRGVAALPPGLG